MIECPCDAPKKRYGSRYKVCDACYPALKKRNDEAQLEKHREYGRLYEKRRRNRTTVPATSVPASPYVTPEEAERILCLWEERKNRGHNHT